MNVPSFRAFDHEEKPEQFIFVEGEHVPDAPIDRRAPVFGAGGMIVGDVRVNLRMSHDSFDSPRIPGALKL